MNRHAMKRLDVHCMLDFIYLIIKHDGLSHPHTFLAASSGAGVLWQWQPSPVHGGAGVVGKVHRQTRDFWITQTSCCVAAGDGCTVRHSLFLV